jgi:hypothetical protein
MALLSCSNFYKVTTIQKPAEADFTRTLDMPGRYFIVHSDSSTAFAMSSIAISSDKKKINCMITSLPDNHTVHVNPNPKKKYKTGGNEYDQTAVLTEVHFYTAGNTDFKPGLINEISLDNVTKIEVLEKDAKRSRGSHIVAWSLGIGTVVVIIALAIGSSVSSFHL